MCVLALPQIDIGGDEVSISTIILNADTPQGYILHPLPYWLFTHDCTPIHNTNRIYKAANDTTVVGMMN